MKLDALFVIPGNLRQVYQHLADKHAIEPPIIALNIATYLQRKGASVAIIDQTPDGLTNERIASTVDDIDPLLVIVPVYGYQPSASTQNMPAAREVCRAIKNLRPDIPIMMTGTHCAALPERTLREEPVDFVCAGEGMVTSYELIEALKHGGDLENVRGLWYWLEKPYLFSQTPHAPNIANFDEEVGIPDWELLPSLSKYRAHDWHTDFNPNMETWSPYASIETTIGCPYRCNFCCIQAPFKAGESAAGMKSSANSYRRRSPQSVADEIELLVVKHGVRHIKIHDEMHVLHPGHVLGITALLKERGLGEHINIWAYTRVDTAQDRFLAELRSAGYRWLCVGIEAANSKVRDGALKTFDDNSVTNVVKRITNAGIKVLGNYIFGLPYETVETMKETLQLAEDLNTPHANFYSTMAYPGSDLHRIAVSKGVPLPETTEGIGWIGYSQHAYETFPLSPDAISNAEVLRFRDQAVRRYYDREAYRTMAEQTLGPESLIRIDEFLAQPPLKRKIIEEFTSATTTLASAS